VESETLLGGKHKYYRRCASTESVKDLLNVISNVEHGDSEEENVWEGEWKN
jgi:hypothetical protein